MQQAEASLKSLQSEFDNLRRSIEAKIAQKIPSAAVGSDERRLLVNQASRELEEADEIVAQMEQDLLSLPPAVRSKFSPIVRQNRDILIKAKRALDKAKTSFERTALLSGYTGSSSSGSTYVVDMGGADPQRSRLLAGTERLENSSQRLENMQRLAMETEIVGVSTLNELNDQREQILRTRDTLHQAESWITKSQGVLQGMFFEMTKYNLMKWGFIVILIIVIVAIVYLRWFA